MKLELWQLADRARNLRDDLRTYGESLGMTDGEWQEN